MEPTIYGVAILAAFGLGLFLLERFVPLRRSTASLLGRLVVNLVFSGLALVAATQFVAPAVEASFGWLSEKPFGLLHLVALPAAVGASTSPSWRCPPDSGLCRSWRSASHP